MKRSFINNVIKDMEILTRSAGFYLPPFAYWTPSDWTQKGEEYQEIFDNHLGWDVTDFGLDKFYEEGLALFTIRNGNILMKDLYKKSYAEKILMLYGGQKMPMHYHKKKMEDIINRGKNSVYITVYNGNEHNDKLDSDVVFSKDGCRQTVKAGTIIELKAGESITITPYLFHEFAAYHTGQPLLLGEVSMCNDDVNDNYFYDRCSRFSSITEDCKPYRVLCNEYNKYVNNGDE